MNNNNKYKNPDGAETCEVKGCYNKSYAFNHDGHIVCRKHSEGVEA